MGISLLMATMTHSYRRKAPLWKDSLLLLLYHGLEEHKLRDFIVAHDICGMEVSAEKTMVRLAPSKNDGHTVLKEQLSTKRISKA